MTETLETYYNAEGEVDSNAEGVCKTARVFNENKKVVSETYKDADDSLILKKTVGYAKVNYTYDEAGNKASEMYFDTQEQPTMCLKGYAGIQYTYNAQNKCTQEVYVDGEGNMMVSEVLGYAGIARTYDENGELVTTSYLDETGANTETASGNVNTETDYDDAGRKIEERFVDGSGNLVMTAKGYAKVTHTYNENGLESETHGQRRCLVYI